MYNRQLIFSETLGAPPHTEYSRKQGFKIHKRIILLMVGSRADWKNGGGDRSWY